MKHYTLSILALLVFGLVAPTHSAQAFLWFGDDAPVDAATEEPNVFMQATYVANEFLTQTIGANDTLAWTVKTLFKARTEFRKNIEVDGEAELHDKAYFNKLAKAKTLKVTGDSTIGNDAGDVVTIDGKINRTLGNVYVNDGLRVTGELDLDTESVDSDEIANGTILSRDIADGKLLAQDFKDGTITDGKLADSYQTAYQQILVVSHDGSSDTASGTTLVNTITGITDATASNQYLVKIGPGTFDIGTAEIDMIPFVDIEGSGEDVTTVTSDPGSGFIGVFSGADNAELRSFTVENTGGSSVAIGIAVDDSSPTFRNLTVNVSGGTAETNGFSIRETAGTADVQLTHVTVNSTSSGTTSYGVVIVDGSTVRINDSSINVGGGSGTNRGVSVQETATLFITDSFIDATGGTNSQGIVSFNTALTYLQNSHVSSVRDSIVVAGTGTVEIRHSNIQGDENSLEHLSTGTLLVGASKVDGPLSVAPGTLTCVGAYNASYIALGTDCSAP